MNDLQGIKNRNQKVELDKAWETSKTRKGLIAVITYAIAAYFMWRIGIEEYLLNALIPTGGFILSTLTLSSVKKMWIEKYFASKQ